MHDHEAPAADVARRRMRDRQSERGGHRGINGISAFFKNRETDVRRRHRDGNDDAVAMFAGSRLSVKETQRDAEKRGEKAEKREATDGTRMKHGKEKPLS